jgi:pentose-5-phosphate-3-epimerase
VNEALAALAREHGGLAGSILGLSPEDALAACRLLRAAGDGVHLDVIDAAYPMAAGVGEDVWGAFGDEQWSDAEVHLMVGRAPDALQTLARAARMTVHLASPRDDRVIDDVLAMRDRVWISIEPQHWRADDVEDALTRYPVDGVLLMLTPPATPGRTAEPGRLREPAVAAAFRLGPIGIDGGVTDEIISLAADRGVTRFVIGRALFDVPSARPPTVHKELT